MEDELGECGPDPSDANRRGSTGGGSLIAKIGCGGGGETNWQVCGGGGCSCVLMVPGLEWVALVSVLRDAVRFESVPYAESSFSQLINLPSPLSTMLLLLLLAIMVGEEGPLWVVLLELLARSKAVTPNCCGC